MSFEERRLWAARMEMIQIAALCARTREREREREDPARRRIPPPLGGEDMLLSKNQDNGGISAGEQRAKCYASRTVIPHPVISALHYVRLIKSDPPLPLPCRCN